MATDRYLIAPFEMGLVNNLKPWLIPDKAFTSMRNAYTWRGRIVKRFGSNYTGILPLNAATQQLQSRLRIALPIIVGNTGTVPGIIWKVGQLFSIGTDVFTVVALGTGPAPAMLTTSTTITATFDTTTGAYVFTGAPPSSQIYFYPSEPVMGFALIANYPINNRPAFAYDTQFIYTFTGSDWERTGTAVTFTGTNYDYFWTTNWQGITPDTRAMFVTNNTTADGMYYSNDGITYSAFAPQYNVNADATKFIIKTAKIILPFRNRLILLDTQESKGTGGTYFRYPNRCRYSHNGSPLTAVTPANPPAFQWYEGNQVGADGAGYIDLPIREAIISAEFIKDRLIVYCERSTWELVYTANEVLPFVWQKLNTELGSESTFSSVPFDTAILNIGSTGIHACNGVNVERIDDQIPDEIFRALNDATSIKRIAGIRDYDRELVYWSIPNAVANDTNHYPDTVMVYNYKNNSWAINDDCITAWGYFEQSTAPIWGGNYETWADNDSTWDSGVNLANHRNIIGGNQFGFVFLINKDTNTNAAVLQVTNVVGNVFTIINHNLATDDFLQFKFLNGLTLTNDIYQVVKLTEDTVSINETPIGTYLGGGTASLVSRLNIQTKDLNPYIDQGRNLFLNKIIFAVTRTSRGQVQISYDTSSAYNLDLVNEGSVAQTNSNIGTYVLETSPQLQFNILEFGQERLWHAIYFNAYGSSLLVGISYSDTEMLDSDIISSDFELQGMILETRAADIMY